MAFFDRIEHMVEEYSRRAIAEGRAAESHFLALIKEMLMTTAKDVQDKLNSVGERLTQVESDVKGLLGEISNPPPASVPVATQEQIDSLGTAVDGLESRLDALHSQVVSAKAPVSEPAPPPTEPPPEVAPTPSAPGVAP